MLSFWHRLPAIVRGVVAGAFVATAGVVPWTLFVTANQKVLLSVPWAVLPTAVFLWFFWRYLKGEPPHADWELLPTTPWNYALAIDPALASSIIMTTVTDVAGFPTSAGCLGKS